MNEFVGTVVKGFVILDTVIVRLVPTETVEPKTTLIEVEEFTEQADTITEFVRVHIDSA